MDRHLRARGDAKFRTVADIFATATFAGHMEILKANFGETVTTLDSAVQTDHLLRMQTVRQVLLRVMADSRLDALVFANTTIPPPIIFPSRVAAVTRRGPNRECSRRARPCRTRRCSRRSRC